MRKLIKIALIVTFMVASTVRVNAAILDSQFIKNTVKNDVEKQVNSFIPGNINVDITDIPYKTLEVPEGNVEIKSNINLNHFSPLTVVKVDVFVNNDKVKTFGVPVKLSVYDKVWVATDTINRGDSLNNQNLTFEKKEISLMAEYAARQNFNPEKVLAKRTFKPGDVIDIRHVETIPDVMKNNLVSIIFRTPSLTITLSGQALDDGKVGDFVRVRNKNYKKDYIGRVINSNTILVNI